MIALTHYHTACSTETELFDDIRFPQRVHWLPETYHKVHTGMHYPPHKLAHMALDQTTVNLIRDVPSKKTAFLLAGGNAHFAGINNKKSDSRLSYDFKFLPVTLTQVFAGRIGHLLKADDHIAADASACASSLKTMMDVQTLIHMYGFTRVVVLTVEDAVSNLVLDFFGETKACLTLKGEESGKLPSAFDAVNGQFHVGQGAAFAVFESEEGLAMSGFTPKAYLLGAYTASERCANAMGQLEDGTGFVRAAEGAIEMAKVKPSDIRIVKTHGTGTESNNKAEGAALTHLLPDGFVATSLKPTIGHTMGASGLLETALLLDALRENTVPAIKNRTEDDRVYLSEAVTAPDGLVLSMAAGMGNIYSAAVFKRA
jgi:3-oxoacyl-(acyl-carrier-protein) synthase